MKIWTGEVKSIALALGLVLVVRTVVAEPYTVPSPSMVPTLLVGDELIGSKFAYGYGKYSSPIGLMPDFAGRLFDRAPERGDVVVFRLPRDPSQTYVKRLIGLPGDRIQMREGRLYINDTVVPRRQVGAYEGDTLYIESLPASGGGTRDHEILEVSDSQAHDDTPVFVVPERHYFMMGDNRDDSIDSRVPSGVGYVPFENLIGKAQVIFFSIGDGVPAWHIWSWPWSVRWSRLLTIVR
jgi:signal peptidase I